MSDLASSATSPQPTSIAVEGRIIHADGSTTELGTLAYSHRSWWRNLLGQRNVRGGGIARSLLGRGPKVREH